MKTFAQFILEAEKIYAKDLRAAVKIHNTNHVYTSPKPGVTHSDIVERLPPHHQQALDDGKASVGFYHRKTGHFYNTGEEEPLYVHHPKAVRDKIFNTPVEHLPPDEKERMNISGEDRPVKHNYMSSHDVGRHSKMIISPIVNKKEYRGQEPPDPTGRKRINKTNERAKKRWGSK